MFVIITKTILERGLSAFLSLHFPHLITTD